MDRPTFSPSWSRVSRLTPALRPHVQITRQVFRGEPWHVVHDPVTNTFFRLNPVSYHLIALLDGKRTVDDCWRLTLERHGDDAPTQNEVIGLLSQLTQANLLRIDLPADAEPLLRRADRRRFREWSGQALSILFIRIPLFNPNRLLDRLLPLFRPLLSRWGAALWALWIGYALWQFLPNLGRFAAATRHADLLAPANWGWMLAVFLAIKVIHEFGHGLICKRFGGAVPEVGVCFMVGLPSPYVDATSSWNFTDKWRRLLVGAAGMIFELAVAAGAAVLWLHTDDGLLRQLCHNAVILASVTTVAFNANPLLRFDGYYMLSDLTETPNLYDRATRQIRWLVQRHAFGVTRTPPLSSRAGERAMLTFFGIGSGIYRLLIVSGIILLLLGQWFSLGILAAGWAFFAWFVMPAGKFMHWLLTSPVLDEHRGRAVMVTAGTLLLALLVLEFVPVRDYRRAAGVVESAQRSDLTMGTDGFVTRVRAASGQQVRKGQILLEADNPALRAQHRELTAHLRELRLVEQQAMARDAVALRVNRRKIETLGQELANVEERLDALVIRSPQDGTLISPPLNQWQGRFVKRGEVIGKVMDLRSLRVTALVDQAQNASPFFNQIEVAEVRTAGRIERVIPSQVLRIFDAGRSTLPHPALGYQGGGQIATKSDDRTGRQTQRPQFELWLDLPLDADADAPAAYPGERAYVRFTLKDRKPLLEQWIHRLRQVIRERMDA